MIRTKHISPASGDTFRARCERCAVKTDRASVAIVLDSWLQLQQHDIVVNVMVLGMCHESFHAVSPLMLLSHCYIVCSHHYRFLRVGNNGTVFQLHFSANTKDTALILLAHKTSLLSKTDISTVPLNS